MSSSIPGYKAGTWQIDAVHTDISFTVRHMMVSKVRGHFGTFEGTIVTGENPTDSTATISIDVASVNTNNEQRDGHLRTGDFFDAETHPKMTFETTGIFEKNDGLVAEGNLTMRGVSKPVSLEVEVNGFGPDAFGGYRAGFSAKTEIDRTEWGVNYNAAIEAGGMILSDKVQILLEVEAVLQP